MEDGKSDSETHTSSSETNNKKAATFEEIELNGDNKIVENGGDKKQVKNEKKSSNGQSNGHSNGNGHHHNYHHRHRNHHYYHLEMASSRQVVKFSEYLDDDIADFQYVNQFIKHLPYFNKIKANAFSELDLIKTNLAKSILLNEIRPGLVHWTNRLQTYINEYGLFFTKSDHLRFINIYMEIISTPDIDLVVVDLCFSILVELLKKYELLKREELIIDWRPIYRLYLRVHKIDECSSTMVPENIEQISFVNLISFARIFFDINATAEMLEEWRPLMCPFDMSMNDAFERFNLFLPTLLSEDESKYAFELWLTEFLDLWLVFSGKTVWESNMINLFSRVASDNVGRIDWTPYIPHIFSKTLRGLGLTLASEFSLNISDNTPKDSLSFVNTLNETFSYSEVDIDSLGTWIVSMIGCGGSAASNNRSMCMQHIKHLFFILRSYYHPSNSGSVENLFSLLQRLPEALIERIRFEKLKKYELIRKGRPADSYITNDDIKEFVLALKDIVLMSIYSKTSFNDAIKTYQYLCFLRSDIMLPPLIDQIYSMFEQDDEPSSSSSPSSGGASEETSACAHRYTPLLACLVSVPRELVAYDARFPRLQKHVIQLLRDVLPGIDINDLNKFILTFQFLTNVLGNIVICDCSAAIDIRTDMNEFEKELCLLTVKFEDFINELLNKIFAFVDHLASDTSAESSAAATVAASIYSRNNQSITDENVTQVHVIQMLKVLIGQSSKAILKIIINKTYKFINGNSYNFKSGDVLASLIGFLVSSGYGREAFEKFFDYAYGNLMRFKDGKNYSGFIQSENGDAFIMWNLHLLSHLLKASGLILVEYIKKIKDILHWYRNSISKDCILHLTSCYNNLINSLTRIYPRETCSVQYSLIFDDEAEFFSKYLPIRDWGRYIKVSELNVDYHIPTVNEIEIALEIVGNSLTESMSFLKKSLFYSKRDETSANKQSRIAKEENYRELNYIYHIMYGASCLLKRPVNREFVTDHIDSNVAIGLNENINKGLGFEFLNVNNSDHEYSKLSVEGKDVLLNMRQTLIEFIIKMSDRIIDDKSNDTNLLILISRILTTACSIFGIFASEFEKTWKSHFVNKSTIQNKLVLKKYPREEIIRRVNLQYMYRCFHLHMSLIDFDFKAINILTNLAINSLYEIVREEARTHLFELLGQYPYSAMTILPTIVKFLNKTSSTSSNMGGSEKKTSSSSSTSASTKEQLEGCLLLLKGNNKQTSMFIKQNWFILSKLWPALFKCKNFDKESIQMLLDKIFFNANLNFNSFDNRVKLNVALVQLSFELCSNAAESYSSDELRLKLYNQKCNYENHLIGKLMEDLIYIAKDSGITWKNQEISLFSLIFLLNSCESHKKLLTYDCVELFVNCLVHENINLRRIAVDALCIILKMVKYKKEIKECDTVDMILEINPSLKDSEIAINTCKPGYRVDNNWYLYDPNYVNVHTINDSDCANWEKSKFLDKSYWGYYCWPSTLRLNSNKRGVFSYVEIDASSANLVDSSATNEYAEAVKPIREKFQYDNEFINKFIRLATVESVKGGEKYDKKRFYLFKALFRNFGTVNIFNNVFEHLTALVSEKNEKTRESSHKLAAEILSGCIRGSKYWNLNVLKYLWSKMKPLFDLIMENICTETLSIWIDCFSNSFEDQDPRRMVFYLNYFQDLMIDIFYEINKAKIEIKQHKLSLKQLNILNLLTALNQFEWRIPMLWSNLTDSFISNMSHPNKAIRELMPSCAIMAITSEIDYSRINNREKLQQSTTTSTNGHDSSENHLKSKSRSSLDHDNNSQQASTPTPQQALLDDDNFNKFVGQIEIKLIESIELYDMVNDETSTAEARKEKQRTHIDELLASANFLQTLLNFLILYLSRSLQPLNLEIMRLIPSLCKIDKVADENTKTRLAALRMLIPIWSLDKNCINLLIEELCEIAKLKNWRSRVAAIQIIKNFCIFNIFLLDEDTKDLMRELAIGLVVDDNIDVRLSACLCLTGFFHSNFIQVKPDLIDRFKNLANIDVKVKDAETGKVFIDQANMAKKHGGILGLCSLVNASTYEVPDYLPDVVAFLCQFVNGPTPIQDSVKKCLNEFKRTHHDNWQEHKRKFNDSQLLALSEVLISSPNFYL